MNVFKNIFKYLFLFFFGGGIYCLGLLQAGGRDGYRSSSGGQEKGCSCGLFR